MVPDPAIAPLAVCPTFLGRPVESSTALKHQLRCQPQHFPQLQYPVVTNILVRSGGRPGGWIRAQPELHSTTTAAARSRRKRFMPVILSSSRAPDQVFRLGRPAFLVAFSASQGYIVREFLNDAASTMAAKQSNSPDARFKGLTLLRRSQTLYADSPDKARLESFRNLYSRIPLACCYHCVSQLHQRIHLAYVFFKNVTCTRI